jgi:hypothetical protein
MITTAEQERIRVQLLQDNIPEIFTPPRSVIPPKLLYVGGGPGKLQLLSYLTDYDTTLLEIHEPNLVAQGPFTKVLGDVTRAHRIFKPNTFDVAVWWHGPEHLYYSDISHALWCLELVTRDWVVLGAPFGYYPQDAVDDNVHERHLSHLLPIDFHKWGYQWATVGEVETGPESCLIGWKDIRKGYIHE